MKTKSRYSSDIYAIWFEIDSVKDSIDELHMQLQLAEAFLLGKSLHYHHLLRTQTKAVGR